MSDPQAIDFSETDSVLDGVLSKDRFSLQKTHRHIKRLKERGQDFDHLQVKLQIELLNSKAAVLQRLSRVPEISYPPELPVVKRRKDIAEAIANNQVVILAGETGSGKTTQLPKICMELGRGSAGLIGHTQPRRLAARSVANRIAEELQTELGDLVGYQVRFTDKVSANTAIKLMTDGILLAEIQHDRYLSRYDTLIIDEAHERSLNIDFLLGYLRQLLPKRPDLKIIVTSATIDVDRFSEHFENAPVLEVSGRTFPVEVHYREPNSSKEAEGDSDTLAQSVLSALEDIETLAVGQSGDVLIFLSGERDIRELSKQIRHRNLPHTEVLPLYARLSNAEQNRVFDTKKRLGRRIILATNVAETSLTVPGIRYVIDPGFARISRYSYRTKIQSLPIEVISQASANQRKGRCGRVSDGICIRLYSEQDFINRPEFTDPEIKRTNLAAVILQMLHLRLGDIEQFPFIEPPDQKMIRDGYKLLEELAAVDSSGELTSIGRKLARLPVDPRLGRMVLAAAENHSLREMLIIASALNVQDPRERPAEKQQAADEQHRRFWHEQSDFMAYVNLWDYYEEKRQELSQGQLRKLGKKEFLSFLKMREWRDIHFQLTLSCKQLGYKPNSEPADYAVIHKALISGLLSHLANWQEDRDYLGSRNRIMQIFPGSSQSKKKPKWMIAAEIVETSRVFARTVAKIEPEWVLGIHDGLLKRHYYEPHWQMRSGRVMAFERISLFGLVILDKRKIHYGPINRVEARKVLIRSGLVENRCRERLDFLQHNQKQLQDLEKLEAKFRRRDIVASEQVLFEFYDQRVPSEVITLRGLTAWLKKSPQANEQLKINRSELLLREPDSGEQAQFPDQIVWQDMSFDLSYHFEPGHPRDGVSMTVPIGLINRLPVYRFEWLVAGLLREKCVQMIKSLPKSIRKNFVPVPDYVDRALADVEPEDISLIDFLTKKLQRIAGIKLDVTMWRDISLDDYYRLNYIVVDAKGQLLAEGRDLEPLLDKCRDQLSEVVASSGEDSINQSGLTRWDFGELPEQVTFVQAGMEIRAYPALVGKGDSVSLELMDYPEQARNTGHRGLVNLLRLQCAQQVRYLRKNFLRGNDLILQLAACGLDREAMIEDMTDAVFAQVMLDGQAIPRDKLDFEARIKKGQSELVNIANEYELILSNVFKFYADVALKLKKLETNSWQYARNDMQRQIEDMVYPGFMLDTEIEYLKHLPRYFKAMQQRLERLSGQYQRDEKHTQVLIEMRKRIDVQKKRDQHILINSPELKRFRWMLEEYRVSLFAQGLGTSMAVSEKRLQEQWQVFDSSC